MKLYLSEQCFVFLQQRKFNLVIEYVDKFQQVNCKSPRGCSKRY